MRKVYGRDQPNVAFVLQPWKYAKKKDKSDNEKKRKHDELTKELDTAILKKKKVEKTITSLIDEADEKAEAAASTGTSSKVDYGLLIASNALRTGHAEERFA